MAAQTIGELALQQARATESWNARRELTLALLLAPDFSPKSPELDALAAQIAANAPEERPAPLLAGVLAYRRNQFDEALRLLSPLAAERDDIYGGLACAFAAMAYHGSANDAEATNLMQEARGRLELLLRPGHLGYTPISPGKEWLSAAQFVLACREAELLIHGRRIWPQIDETYLAAARERWKLVKALLDEFDMSGSQRNWAAAYDRLREAVQHEYFDWSAALHNREYFALKASVTMLLSGDIAAYEELCHRLVRYDLRPGKISPCSVLLLRNSSALEAAIESILQATRLAAQDAGYSEDGHPWWSVDLGLAELRAGNPQAALSALEPAENAYNLFCSGKAHVVAALAMWDMGQQEAAREKLSSAESAFEQVIEDNRGTSVRWWQGMAGFELLLGEARRVVGSKH